MNKSLDILLVDDYQIVIEGIKLLLKNNQIINNVYEALNGIAALDILKKHEIDIIITDVKMPEMTGLELIQIIKAKYPLIKIIVLSTYNDISIIKEIINLNVEGYILKNTSKIELDKALNEIAAGGKYYYKEINIVI